MGNSPVTGEFPAQVACNAENVSIWWRHHDPRHKENQELKMFKLALLQEWITANKSKGYLEAIHNRWKGVIFLLVDN